MARTPHVTLALCTFRGQALCSASKGIARRLTGVEAKRARKLICAGLAGLLVNCFFALRYPRDKTAMYEVTLADQSRY